MLKLSAQVSSLVIGKANTVQKICTETEKNEKEEKKASEKQLKMAECLFSLEKKCLLQLIACNIKALSKFHDLKYTAEHIGSVPTPPPNKA